MPAGREFPLQSVQAGELPAPIEWLLLGRANGRHQRGLSRSGFPA
jgi:hypothetical protein